MERRSYHQHPMWYDINIISNVYNVFYICIILKDMENICCVCVLIIGCSTSNDCQGFGRGFCDFSNSSTGNCVVCSSLQNSHNFNGSCQNANLTKLGVKSCQQICKGEKFFIYMISFSMYKID